MKHLNVFKKMPSIFNTMIRLPIIRWVFVDLINKRKKQYELNYWRHLIVELTKDCKDLSEKEETLMRVSYEITFPRYKKDLYLENDSFKGKKVLDVGCGPHGGLIGFTNCKKFGLDHLIEDYKKLGYPLNKHKIKYYHTKSESMPFPNSYFDVIVCVNALDHFDSLKKTIKEISRVLKKGGKFIGQFNFHDEPSIGHPIVLDHKKLIGMLLKHNLILVKRIFQYHIDKEDRYYYECEKI